MDYNDAERTSARLLHVEEAAKLLSIGRTKAYELIANGQLHAIRLGRATRSAVARSTASSAASTASAHPQRRTARRAHPRRGEQTLFDPEPPAAA
jgi:excisionase family DNA binding protein